MSKVKEFMDKAKPSDYIDLMVKALQNPKIEIVMGTYGVAIDNICYGCAATNALCELTEKTFDVDNIWHRQYRAAFLNEEWRVIARFEISIDNLRRGLFYSFLIETNQIKPTDITIPNLPHLGNNYTQQDLDHYINFSNYLKTLNL